MATKGAVGSSASTCAPANGFGHQVLVGPFSVISNSGTRRAAPVKGHAFVSSTDARTSGGSSVVQRYGCDGQGILKERSNGRISVRATGLILDPMCSSSSAGDKVRVVDHPLRFGGNCWRQRACLGCR